MSEREIEAVDITRLYDFFAERAVEIFNERKECMPQIAAVVLGAKPGDLEEMVMVDPRFVNELQRDGQAKDRLMNLIRVLLDERLRIGLGLPELPHRPPDAVVHVSETWVLQASTRDALEEYGGSVKDHPERREAVMVTVHTKDRSYVGTSLISGTGAERTATVGPLFRNGVLEGRLIMQDGQEEH